MPGFPSGDRVKLGIRIVVWPTPRMFCEESWGKIKFRAFPERVCPRILSLGSVDYFGTSEHFSGQKKKKKNLNWQNFDLECCKLAFHANDPSEEHAVYFRRWLKWRALFSSRFLSLAIISLESRPLNFRLIIRAYSPQVGYSGFQVTGMTEGFLGVWNFQFRDFFRLRRGFGGIQN